MTIAFLPFLFLAAAQEPSLQKLDASAQEVSFRAQHFLRLQNSLRLAADELRVGPAEELSLDEYSRAGLVKVRRLRRAAAPGSAYDRALSKVEKAYARLPALDYARDYADELAAAISEELRFAADRSGDEAELLSVLDRDLDLPATASAVNEFPEDLTLEQFKALGSVKDFMVKHRLGRPKSYVKTTWADIEDGKHHVQIGAEIEGTVGYVDDSIDKDYCFNVGDVELELTPDWQVLHPFMKKPRPGDRVRVRGWTFYDVFHKAEREWDPKNPVTGDNRKTLWEIHPVNDIEILH